MQLSSFTDVNKTASLWRQRVCMPVCWSVQLTSCLSVCLPVFLSVCLSDCLPVCLAVCLSVHAHFTMHAHVPANVFCIHIHYDFQHKKAFREIIVSSLREFSKTHCLPIPLKTFPKLHSKHFITLTSASGSFETWPRPFELKILKFSSTMIKVGIPSKQWDTDNKINNVHCTKCHGGTSTCI